jgi:hypothetical protein
MSITRQVPPRIEAGPMAEADAHGVAHGVQTGLSAGAAFGSVAAYFPAAAGGAAFRRPQTRVHPSVAVYFPVAGRRAFEWRHVASAARRNEKSLRR